MGLLEDSLVPRTVLSTRTENEIAEARAALPSPLPSPLHYDSWGDITFNSRTMFMAAGLDALSPDEARELMAVFPDNSLRDWNHALTALVLPTAEERVAFARRTGAGTTDHSGKDPKAGAKFKLFKKKAGYTKGSEYIADNSLLIGEAVTDNKGRMKFTGLDAGKYVLVETQAPQGYAKNDTPVDVNISATLNADGTLKSYSISIAGKITETYTAVYNSQKEVTKVDKTGEVGEFNNYKLGTLPSTGGIGTYLFYIVGAVLVVLAGSMLVRHRKKDRTHHDENSH